MKKTKPIQKRKGAMRRKRARQARWDRQEQAWRDRLRDTGGTARPRYDDIFFQGVAWLNGL